MNKIFLGAVFGLTIMGSAGASIISRGFFDEQIGNYATLDSLNSKADKSEIKMLTGQIVDSIDDLLKPLWDGEARDLVSGFNPNKVNIDIYGAFWLIEGYLTFLSSGLINGWTDTNGTEFLGLKDVNTKIGDLPIGDFPGFPGYEYVLQPLTYPTSLAELITALYGNSETGAQGLLATIINGFPLNGNPDEYVGLIQNFYLARDAFLGASANTAKIGTLPAGYDSVGAALTAIKGIAEDAKAAALAAIPDPRAEGSSGKFVLTVDVIGDNATYHWEKIDRTLDEEQQTLE